MPVVSFPVILSPTKTQLKRWIKERKMLLQLPVAQEDISVKKSRRAQKCSIAETARGWLSA